MNKCFGGYDMRRYTNNTLSTVIFRVDFVKPINVEDDTLDKACMDIYPVMQREVMNEQTVTTNFNEKGEMSVERSVSTFTNKKYSNRQLTRYIKVSPKFVLTEVKDYVSYADTSATFAAVFEAIRKSNPNAVISRIGMRYINQVDLSAYKKTARKNYVKSSLFESAYDSAIENALQARTQHLVELVIDDYRVRCVTGLFNPDYPAAIKRNIVTLDFDAFIQGNVDSADVAAYLDKFHTSIQALYEESILSKQRDQMGLITDDQ
ncbi:MAG: TIGR04255 family protein [Oscillospiraceae bacterium]|nr:TIGR04255 family protein [Oscillospiraceae bacterium]